MKWFKLALLTSAFAFNANYVFGQEAATRQAIDMATRSLLEAVSSMEAAANDIQSGKITTQTLVSQKAALSSLDQLIRMADQLPQSGSEPAKQNADANNDQDQPKQPNQQSSDQPTANGDKRRQDQKPQEATSGVGAGNTSAAAGTQRRRVLVQEVWGHLPPDLKRRLMSTSDEKPLPKYQESVARYFRALAEQGRKRTATRVRTPTTKPAQPQK